MTMIKKYILAAVAVMMSVASYAVTDKEMEQARAITAQTYLRYANDGSDYLDKLDVATLSELEGKLKKTEQENIKAFKSVAVPKDYASWDKAKLVEYWSVTFFKSPGLTDKGKIAKARVKRKLEAMTVSAAPAAAAPAEQEPAAGAPVVKLSDDAEAGAAGEETAAENALQQSEQIAETAAEEIVEDLPARNSSDSTWIYVVILVVLVGVVIWLVVFAANIMKKNGADSDNPKGADSHKDKRSKDEEMPAEKNLMQKEMPAVGAGLQEDDKPVKENMQLRRELARIKAENDKLQVEAESARREIENLRREKSGLLQELENLRRQEKIENDVKSESNSIASPERETSATIYLGRVNRNGLFIRADRRMNIGNSVYRLDTRDGVTGTFRVVNDPTINSLIMADPAVMLGGGCTADSDTDLEGKVRVVNEKSGTAILENNCWKVLRKAKVRFE